jgi:predicted alpha/beta hydrolase family esterase
LPSQIVKSLDPTMRFRPGTPDNRASLCHVSILVVPGWTNAGPEHWMSHWERSDPTMRRVEQADWEAPDLKDWVASIDASVAKARAPVVLVAHSLGCPTVAQWGRTTKRSISHALLVAPTDLDLPDTAPAVLGFRPIPRTPLPFPSTVVASRTDPLCPWPSAVAFAEAWGSRLIAIGDAGHVNTASGHGPWPEGRKLLADLVSHVQAGQQRGEGAAGHREPSLTRARP